MSQRPMSWYLFQSAAFHIDFDAEALLSALRCQSVCSTLCGLQLWASWLLRAGKPCCLRIKAQGHNDPQFPLPVDIMRELFIRIQQCLLQVKILIVLARQVASAGILSSQVFLNIRCPTRETQIQFNRSLHRNHGVSMTDALVLRKSVNHW